MTYHTNHCWCSKSNWNDESFHGEVMVYFGNCIDTDSISEYNNKIPDPDFENLTDTKSFFNEKETLSQIAILKKPCDKFNDQGYLENVKINSRKTVTLKPSVIKWLNKNVKDRTNLNEDNNTLAEKRGWCIGNDEYNSEKDREISVFLQDS